MPKLFKTKLLRKLEARKEENSRNGVIVIPPSEAELIEADAIREREAQELRERLRLQREVETRQTNRDRLDFIQAEELRFRNILEQRDLAQRESTRRRMISRTYVTRHAAERALERGVSITDAILGINGAVGPVVTTGTFRTLVTVYSMNDAGRSAADRD